jgi:hypothetical protein
MLDRTDANGDWSRSASTFSDWMGAEAQKLGLGASNLWRYLASVRYYETLRRRLSGAGFKIPRLLDLPSSVSPENLEILSKLERAMPAVNFNELASDVLAGQVTRAKLRDTWLAFRPALGGRTARGKGAQAPTIDPRDPDQHSSVLEALVYTALSNYGPSWTGAPNPAIYQLITNVVPEPNSQTESRTTLDLVAVIQEVKDGPILLHGVEIRGNNLVARVPRMLQAQSLYCHSMWLAVPKVSPELDALAIPAKFGLLVTANEKIQVVRKAEQRPNDGLTGQLAKGLVARLLGR